MIARKTTIAIALSVLAGVLAVSAQAAPILVTYGGTITSVEDPDGLLGGAVVVGDTFSGSVVYDPETAVDQSENPRQGRYLIGTPVTGHLGQLLFESDKNTLVFVGDDTGYPPPVRDILRFSAFRDYYEPAGEGMLAFTNMEMLLVGETWVFDSDALSTEFNLDDFTVEQSFSIMRGPPPELLSSENEFEISGTVTSLAAVPELATLSLLALGVLLGCNRRYARCGIRGQPCLAPAPVE